MGKLAKVQETKNEVVKSTNAMPPFMTEKVQNDAGKGVSSDADDNMVPLIYVLQSLSPVCQKGNPARIEGAEAGDFWLRNASNPIVSGETGLLFQPCYFTHAYVEWMPDRGGFVGQHATMPADVGESVVDPQNPNKTKFVRSNGNEMVETRNHVGFVITDDGSALPYILPFSGSGHTVSKGWMFTMNSKRLAEGGVMPAWACLYRLKTKLKTNAFGSWFLPYVEDAGYVQTAEAYDRGAALYEAFASGEKKAAAPDSDAAVDGDEVPF